MNLPQIATVTGAALASLATLQTPAVASLPQANTIRSRERIPIVPDAGGPAIHQTRYSPDDFGYVDPNPAGYHPLGAETTRLITRDEIFVAQPDRGASGTTSTLVDDERTGYADLGLSYGLEGARVRSTAAGNVDGDMDDELVVLLQDQALDQFHLAVYDGAGAPGAPSFELEIYRPFGEDCVEGRVTLGDVDGDGRDEFLVAGRPGYLSETHNGGWVRVYDDVVDDGGLMFETPYGFLCSDVQVIAADVDGDGRDEIAMFGENALYGDLWILPFDDAAADVPFQQLGSWIRMESLGSAKVQGRIVAGDYTGDGKDELGVVSMVSRNEGSQQRLTLALHLTAYDGTGFSSFPRLLSGRGLHPQDQAADLHRAFDAVNRRVGGGARDEIVTFGVQPGGRFRPDSFRFNPGANDWTINQPGPALDAPGPMVVTIDAGDVDADGVEEVVVASQFAVGGLGILRPRLFDWTPSGITQTLLAEQNSLNPRIYPPVLAVADLDSDGLIIQATGGQEITLADPIPLVLLTAPPTKSGIDQNYAACSTSYKSSTTSEVSLGVTTTTAISFYSGVTTGPLSDFASAAVTQSLETELTKNEVTTTSTTTFRTNVAGHAEDVMVFQGTLYHGYEYEILRAGDPADVGKRLVISVPVGTREYQWSADLYNQTVDAPHRIPSILRPHTIGDPSTYRTEAQLDVHRAPFVGWRDVSDETVPQSGQRGLGFALTERQTTEEERSITLGVDADFSVGFNAFGGSYSVTSGSMFSVSVEETAEYAGNLGAINDVTDYFRWQYSAGLCMYHYGMDAVTHEPIAGATPFQVVTYWVDPFGAGY
jgi:hypothetical protein